VTRFDPTEASDQTTDAFVFSSGGDALVADSVDAEVLCPFRGLWDAIKGLDDAGLMLVGTRAYNDWMGGFSSHGPDRLIGLGKIPSTSRDDAEAELLRCVGDLHLSRCRS
jgi:hypothetical protein